MRRHFHMCQLKALFLFRPMCCILALIHPLIHGTFLDAGALDALIQAGIASPDPILPKEAE